jgi:hypothetical protein
VHHGILTINLVSQVSKTGLQIGLLQLNCQPKSNWQPLIYRAFADKHKDRPTDWEQLCLPAPTEQVPPIFVPEAEGRSILRNVVSCYVFKISKTLKNRRRISPKQRKQKQNTGRDFQVLYQLTLLGI